MNKDTTSSSTSVDQLNEAEAPVAVEPVIADHPESVEPEKPEESVEPEKPEPIFLSHSVDIVVEDGLTKVFCARTGQQIAGWDGIKPDLKKGTVKLTLEAVFRRIETIDTPPPPSTTLAKDEQQLDMFPGAEPPSELPADTVVEAENDRK